MRLRFALLFASLALLLITSCTSKTQETTTPTPPIDSTATAKMTSLVVHLPNDQPSKVWEVDAGGELTVKELMDALGEAQLQFTDTVYPTMGSLVTSVMGIPNANGEGAYWQFCIDNVASDRGIDEKKVGPGQQVDWHYAKYGELPCKKIGE